MITGETSKCQRRVATNIRRIADTGISLLLVVLLAFSAISCGSDPASPDIQPVGGFEWTTAPPEEHGFDPALLDTLTERINSQSVGRITSLLIARNGYLVYEEYFRGIDRDSLVSIYSCTKSVASALIGIAIGEGNIGGVDDRLFDYLDGYTLFPSHADDSMRRESLTLEHLLTMTAGFEWDELGVPYGTAQNSYNQMIASPNWIQYVLDQEIINSQPGTEWEYNTGLSGLMAVVLENSTGMSADHYAEEKLFRHIGIETCIWRMTRTGVPMTGSGLKLRPRDMAKFGWLYAQNGVWDGDTLVPSWWVQASHQPHVQLPDGRAYGYQWWMAPITDDQGNSLYLPYALGYGGQHIFVASAYDIVIVVTADDDLDVSGSYIFEIVNMIGDALTP